jgi:hypothetical protein
MPSPGPCFRALGPTMNICVILKIVRMGSSFESGQLFDLQFPISSSGGFGI